MASGSASLRWNVGATWISHALCLVIGFFLMPYTVGVLGETSYGAWVFINSIAGYAALLYFGLGGTVCRYVAKHHASQEWESLNQVVSLVLAFYTAMAAAVVAVSLLLAGIAPWLDIAPAIPPSELRLVILLLGLNVAAGLTGSVFGGILMGVRRYDLEHGVSFIADLIRLALIVIFLRREYGLVTIAGIYLFITIIENLAFAVISFRLIPQLAPSFRKLKKSVFQECFSFSGFAFLNAAASQLIYATDTVVIGLMLGTEAIVPYYIALRLCQFIRQPLQQLGDVSMPTAGALAARQETAKLQSLVVNVMGTSLLLSAGMLIGVFYFGDLLIEIWMGKQFVSSHVFLLILFGVQVIALPVGVIRSVLFGMGCVRGPALLYLTEAVLNLVLSVLLAPVLGLYGIALGTAIPLVIVELGLLLPFGLRQLSLSIQKLFRDVIGPQLLPLMALFCFSATVDSFAYPRSWLSLILITAGGGIVLGSAWLGMRTLQRRWPAPQNLLKPELASVEP